jgi:EmrB/QacA subfamily drug resistance transporter
MPASEKTIKRTALSIAVIASFMTPFMGSAINVALPTIGKTFGATAVQISWVATSYILSAAVFLVPLGKLADIVGRKKIYTIGLIIFTISSTLCALSLSINQMIIFRVIQGLGSAMIFSTSTAIITSVYAVGERGRALGINVSSVYIGLSVGPFAGGLLTQNLGWQSIFLVLVPIGLLAIILVFSLLKQEWSEAEKDAFDWKGGVLYGTFIFLIMYGFTLLPNVSGWIFVVSGTLVFIFFLRIEKRTKHPVLEVNLFRKNRVFAFSNLAALINYSATFAVGFLLSLYLQYLKELGPQEAGLILVSQPIIMALLSPFSGRISDRIDPRFVASSGMGLSMLGLIFLIFLTAETGLFLIILNLIVLGIGFALFSSPNVNSIMSSVEKRYLGVASGTQATMRVVGQMMSMGIVMMLFSLFIGHSEINPTNYPQFLKSVKVAFLIFSVLCFVGIFASIARGKTIQNRNTR